MAEPFIGEIRLFAGNFAPENWALCQGQIMSISQNEALFVLIGTTYGGDGQETFALPDLQGRRVVHQGTGRGRSWTIGEKAGAEQVALTGSQLPQHNHALNVSSAPGSSPVPAGNVPAAGSGTVTAYTSNAPNTTMDSTLIGVSGQSVPHDNMPPFLVLNFIIALFGIFPSPN